MNCLVCNSQIPQERLDIFPNCSTCANCSNVTRTIGLMDYAHKTAPQLVILPNNPEQQRIAFRAFKRAR